MKHLWMAAVLVIGACVTNDIIEEVVPPTPQELICEHTQWEGCMDVAEPIVVISDVVSPLYNGFYFHGEPYIFINPYLGEPQTYYTIVHETVHYLIEELGLTELNTRCKSELTARLVTAAVTEWEYEDKWIELYKCGEKRTDIFKILKGLY